MRHYVSIAATICTGSSLSTAVNIEEHNGVMIDCPTWSVGCATAGAALQVMGCDTSDGTFRTIYHSGVSSAASGGVVWEMLHNTGNMLAVFDVQCKPKYIKLHLADNDATANVATRVLLYNGV